MRNHLLYGVAASALAAAIAHPVKAADAEAAAGGHVLEEIVVTATKQETNLQRTPIAISVVGGTVMADRHIQSLINLSDSTVPSLRVATFEARQSALTIGIRGIVPFDANQTARDQGVGVYLDGVYLGRQQGLNAALFDVERIEVLRGPQGTLFGRNTEGGALSIVTKAPTGDFGGRLVAGVGNYGAYNTELHLNLPAYENVSIKVDGVVQHQDETVSNPAAGQTGWNFYHRVGGWIALRWKPTDAFVADLTYDKAVDQNTPFYSQLISYNPLGRPVATLAQMNPGAPSGFIAPLPALVQVHTDRVDAADIGVPQQPSVDKTHGYMANLRYSVAPALELRSISAWRGVHTDQWDNSGGAHRVPFSANGRFSRYSLSFMKQNQFSQEFQAVGHTPQLSYAAGLFYFQEKATEKAATPSTNQWNATGTAYVINDPFATNGNGWQPNVWTFQRASWAKAKSYAAYAQFTYTPDAMDALHLTAGGRYTKDKRNGVLYMVQNKPTNFGFTFDNERFDPMLTVAYDAAPGVNLYAKYSTGFRAGGANDRSQTFTAFAPEKVKAYEVGAKMDLLDRRLRLNLAAYEMNRTGTQTDFDNVDVNPQSPTFNLHTEETRNAPGESKIKGVEVELTARLTDQITAGASYAYTDVRIPPTPNPFLNNVLFPVFVVFTPKNAANGFIDFEQDIWGNGASLRLHLDANYSDETYSFQAEPVKTESSFIVNARAAITDVPMANGEKLTVSLWSRNLLNEEHIYRRSSANAATLGDYANFNAPRTYGIEATLNF